MSSYALAYINVVSIPDKSSFSLDKCSFSLDKCSFSPDSVYLVLDIALLSALTSVSMQT